MIILNNENIDKNNFATATHFTSIVLHVCPRQDPPEKFFEKNDEGERIFIINKNSLIS